ncbi:uncharacterized protein CC84DRAFT_1238923 [Paraphaeosphaeria sporulosa]|uniref:Secreted protein n=1 Tax=Paraphaeosphaeria sporulosa TaxID=1460663 RepID=A0A177CK94_9PLEO|nr:uncharacterized protein CC84DRAFT_1238923 [Paraphaeosphaeria sporulosa]OAG07913.1 hypothetical protein CC84DRAFT_1238923 [Paraphaeosphaeria sporulosa]
MCFLSLCWLCLWLLHHALLTSTHRSIGEDTTQRTTWRTPSYGDCTFVCLIARKILRPSKHMLILTPAHENSFDVNTVLRCWGQVARNFSNIKKDPYILAYQYRRFMDECDMRHCTGRTSRREHANPYYENLLASQDEPSSEATSDLTCALRYTKEHHGCFYDKSQVTMIISILDKQNASIQPSLHDQKRARVDLHNTACPSKAAKERVGRKKRANSGWGHDDAERKPFAPHSRADDGTGTQSHATTSRCQLEN